MEPRNYYSFDLTINKNYFCAYSLQRKGKNFEYLNETERKKYSKTVTNSDL
jgi:hypothetical protein